VHSTYKNGLHRGSKEEVLGGEWWRVSGDNWRVVTGQE
jgi:hypothetical protein